VDETLFMIKPDAVQAHKVGAILSEVERAGFEILDLKLVRLTPKDAQMFYAVRLRELIGATDPKEAKPGTIRALHAESKGRNAVHASDSPESARTEIQFFFGDGSARR
jgi:nucleoside-diphosphate kinase